MGGGEGGRGGKETRFGRGKVGGVQERKELIHLVKSQVTGIEIRCLVKRHRVPTQMGRVPNTVEGVEIVFGVKILDLEDGATMVKSEFLPFKFGLLGRRIGKKNQTTQLKEFNHV